VHEHGRQNGDPVVAGNDLGGDRGPLGHVGFAAHQLKHENDRIYEDDEGGDDGDARRASRHIA